MSKGGFHQNSLKGIDLLFYSTGLVIIFNLCFSVSWECIGIKRLTHLFLLYKLSEELLTKWLTFPESQHVPLSQHMLGFAMKTVTQTAMGSRFEDDQEVIRFRRNHDVVSLQKEEAEMFSSVPFSNTGRQST